MVQDRRAWVLQPVSIVIEADQSFSKWYKTGVLRSCSPCPSSSKRTSPFPNGTRQACLGLAARVRRHRSGPVLFPMVQDRRAWVLQPVSIVIEAGQSFSQWYKTGVLRSCSPCPSSSKLTSPFLHGTRQACLGSCSPCPSSSKLTSPFLLKRFCIRHERPSEMRTKEA